MYWRSWKMPPGLDFNYSYWSIEGAGAPSVRGSTDILPVVTSSVLRVTCWVWTQCQTLNNPLWIFCDAVPSLSIFLHPKHFAFCKYFSDSFSSLILEIAIPGGMADYRLHLEVVFPCFPGGVSIPAVEDDFGYFPPGGRRLASQVRLRQKDTHNYFLGQKNLWQEVE